MNAFDCPAFDLRRSDWLDGSLDPADIPAMAAHARGCPACAALVAQERQLLADLRALPAPKARPGFAREALARARLANGVTQPRRSLRDMGFALGGALAAAVVVAMVVPGLRAPGEPAASVAVAGAGFETVSLAAGRVEAVRLRIEAPRDFEHVRFAVQLPEQVALADQPGLRALEWEGALRKGENVLELPLVAQNGAQGVMVARVAWGSFEQRLQTRLVAVPVREELPGNGGPL